MLRKGNKNAHTKIITTGLCLLTIMLTWSVFTQRGYSQNEFQNPNVVLAATNQAPQNTPDETKRARVSTSQTSTSPTAEPKSSQAQTLQTTAGSATAGAVSNPTNQTTPQINEQFSGDSLDTNLWEAMSLPKAYRNNEEQVYEPQQVKVGNGSLQITASRDAGGEWHSGEVHSKWEYTYGDFEVRMALSTTGQGVWPAAWLMGRTDSWPDNGEIDIMENINGDPTVYGTIHGGGTGAQWHWAIQRGYASIAVKQFHTYRVVKEPNYMSWWIDGVKRGDWHRSEMPAGGIWPFESHKNFGLLNLAIGGSWPGPSNKSTPDKIVMDVDYFTVKNAAN